MSALGIVTASAMANGEKGLGGVVLAHPSGNQFFRHLAAALRDVGGLADVCTCIDWRGGWPGWLLPRNTAAELARRSFSRELRVPVATHAWREAARLGAGRMGMAGLVRHETGFFSVDAVYRDFDRWVARRLPDIRGAGTVYAYEDAALATFRAAKALGWQRAYDLPILHWRTSRRLLDEEVARWPEWEPTLIGTRDSAAKHARKDEELALATHVVCPSRFVADSLPAQIRAERRVVIAPFGSPAPAAEQDRARPAGGPLRVLFAGAMTQRKGLADLFAAMRLLRRSDVELVVLGSPVVDMSFYRGAFAGFAHEAPRPHAAVLALMRTCDVFCLPSVVEGRALVVQEAMSQGLPVVVTANTGTEDVVEDGRNGFVVPIRSPAVLAEKISWFADRRAAIPDMGDEARRSASRFTWDVYAGLVLDALGKTISRREHDS